MNKDADFAFQGVKSFLGACRALSDVLAAMEWVQPDISFFGEMFLNAVPSQLQQIRIHIHTTLI